ncbi:MAG TPA: hypothetical protein VFN03_11050 [Trueperaceae bacterium]|nr:hypothetical protein [Trueperaceae bacterium]
MPSSTACVTVALDAKHVEKLRALAKRAQAGLADAANGHVIALEDL